MDFFIQRFVLCRSLLVALFLCGCGGLQEGELLPVEETLGTEKPALCSGLSVTSLTVAGVSTYEGEMAGSGNWTTCSSNPKLSTMYYPNEPCPPPPTSSLSCSRPFKGTEIQCTGSSGGGSGAHTPYWQINTGSWSSGGWAQNYYCPAVCPTGVPPEHCYPYQRQISFKVIDSAGATSNISQSLSYTCYDDIR